MSFSEDAVNALSLGCLATEDKGWTAAVSLFAGPWLGPCKLISGHASLSCLLTRLHLVVIASSKGLFKSEVSELSVFWTTDKLHTKCNKGEIPLSVIYTVEPKWC